MVHLLDVNVLVALFDPSHVHHEAAHAWFEVEREHGWATCPITENGLVRVISNPAYPGRRTTVGDAVRRLAQFTGSGGHVFWPDEVSVLDVDVIVASEIPGYLAITDAYLLALAARQGGRLATFDRSIRTKPVVGAGEANLVQVPVAS